ncbi:MAG: hypothetical protein R2799_05605 [Crocinitomicaceae bacterium]
MKNLSIITSCSILLLLLFVGCNNPESGKEGSKEKEKWNSHTEKVFMEICLSKINDQTKCKCMMEHSKTNDYDHDILSHDASEEKYRNQILELGFNCFGQSDNNDEVIRYRDSIEMNSSFIPPNGIEFLIYAEEKEIYLKYPYLKFEKDSSEIGLPDIVYTDNGNEFRFIFGKSIEVMFCKRTFNELDSISVAKYIEYCDNNYRILEKGKKWLSKKGDKIEIKKIEPNVFIYSAQSDFIKIEEDK